MFKRIFLIVLDSVGIGEASDAGKYNDKGTNTFMHAVESTDLDFPNFKKLGFFNLANNNQDKTISYYTKGIEISDGKDTLTGHLEMTAVITTKPFKTFLNGFPKELIEEIEKISGRKVIGNCVASGTEIIKELGDRQIKTGELYVAYFTHCLIDGHNVDAIGIFKSEHKESFIKVTDDGRSLNIETQKGININKLDKL